MPNRYNKIANFFEYLLTTYNISICVKDFSGFIPIDRELDQVLQPYLAHTNPFCMYIKSDQKTFRRCLDMIRPLYIRCTQGTPFYGVCHAGVGEYVVPIKSGNIVLGAITAGFFPVRFDLSRYLIRRKCHSTLNIEYNTACHLFDQYITPATIEAEKMLILLEMAAEYLAISYLHLKDIHSNEKIPSRRYYSNEDTIIAHALEYIKKNYTTPIHVKDVAAYCHCSESYINHSFKKRVSMNVNTYINKIRIEHAKHSLLCTKDKMTTIAMDVGFGDPNYFSKVFTKLVGNPPSEFRRRFS